MQFQKQSKKYIIPLASLEWRDHNSIKMTPSVWLDLINPCELLRIFCFWTKIHDIKKQKK